MHLRTNSFPGRTIVGLWRTRALSPDQKAQIVEDQDDYEERSKMVEDTEYILDLEDTKMSKVYTADIPMNVSCGSFSFFSWLGTP